MNQEIIEILKEIKSETHLEILLPNKLSNSLKSIRLSLYEICLLSEEDFKKIDKIGIAKHKFLKDFIEEISINSSLITEFKKHILDSPIILPHTLDLNKSIANNIQNVLIDLTNIFKERIKLPENYFNKVEYNSYEPLINYISYYFGINNCKIISSSEIAEKFGKTDWLIRSNLFNYNNRPDLCDLFFRNLEGYGLKINSQLINITKDIIDKYLYSSKFVKEFCFEDDDISNTHLEHLMEIFEFNFVEIELTDTEISYKTVVNKGEISQFRAYFLVIDSLLRNGQKHNKEELLIEIEEAINKLPNKPYNRKIKENGLNIKMVNSILSDYIKIEIIEEENSLKYQFKWQYLFSQIAKTTRILYEYGGIMSKEEIFEEFQNRENELGIEQTIESLDFLHIKTTDNIHPVGKTGNWFYEENYTKEKNSLAQKVNKDIETKFNGKVYLDQFLEYTKSKDFYKNYEVSSIRANVLLYSKQSMNDPNLYIHKDFNDQYSEIELKGNRNKYLGNSIIKIIAKIFDEDERPIEKNELIDQLILKLIEDDIKIKNKNNVFQYLLKFSDLSVLTKIIEGNNIYYQLDKDELNTHDIEKLGKKQEPIYKTNIRAKAITFLKEHPKVKLSEVFELVKDLAPVENAKTNIYKIFNDTSLFIKETIDKEVWISLDTTNLPVPQEMHVEVSEETTEVLGNNPLPIRELFDTNNLKRAIIEELLIEKNTYGLNQDIVFETYESFTEIVLNNQRNSIWGRTLVQSIYENFCTKTDIYDRQICVMNLIGSYETFLKLISPLNDAGRVSGIVEIINSIPEIKELYYYKNQDKYKITDRQKNNFSHILNRVKYMADLYRHDRSSDELAMGNSKMMKFIVDFTALYLYTLYLVDRY